MNWLAANWPWLGIGACVLYIVLRLTYAKIAGIL